MSILLTLALLMGGAVHAQVLRITNEAGGIACYTSQDLMTAQTAVGFHNLDQVQALVVQDKCFIMQAERWKPEITDEIVVGGVNVKIVRVALRSQNESRFVWSLLANFGFIGD